ncbi:unnamed protein product [Pleuronectes platessa]|uniref:Teneurin N-terminal domain-containing protein n=1 Tax=Pleuronectes platessa TaxID=8262 RepID=A0A9N7Y800_PLEPL|nr:unnamed protein product [Pleuronectes platessa]
MGPPLHCSSASSSPVEQLPYPPPSIAANQCQGGLLGNCAAQPAQDSDSEDEDEFGPDSFLVQTGSGNLYAPATATADVSAHAGGSNQSERIPLQLREEAEKPGELLQCCPGSLALKGAEVKVQRSGRPGAASEGHSRGLRRDLLGCGCFLPRPRGSGRLLLICKARLVFPCGSTAGLSPQTPELRLKERAQLFAQSSELLDSGGRTQNWESPSYQLWPNWAKVNAAPPRTLNDKHAKG